MFEELLNGIFERNGLDDKQAQAQYLSALRPYAKHLWNSYQQQDVTADYSETQTQEAYLLRYFPSYTLLVERELDTLQSDGVALPEVELLDACFFGCGPGPEVIGLMQHLAKSKADTTMLTAKFVDIAAETWSHARVIVLAHLTEPLWEPRLLECESFTACLSDMRAMRRIPLEGCHLAVVQNCLNEVPANVRSKVVDNILEAFRRLSPGAIALVIDRSGYDATKEMMRLMHKRAAGIENITPIGDADLADKRISCDKMLYDVPSIITNNVLHRYGDPEPAAWDSDGLIFARRVDYICTAFQVDAVPV